MTPRSAHLDLRCMPILAALFACGCGPAGDGAASQRGTPSVAAHASSSASATAPARTAASASASSAPPATASASESSAPAASASTGSANLPAAWLGHYAYAVDDGVGGPSTLYVVTATTGGVSTPRVVAKGIPNGVTQIAWSADATRLAFTVGSTSDPGSGQSLFALRVCASGECEAPRQVARCGYECNIAGIGSDGEIWYVARETTSLIGGLAHVPFARGKAQDWPHHFSNCAVSGAVSDDGQALVLGVDNSLGWPECIEGGFQGLYVVPIGNPAQRDAKPARIGCFTTKKPKEINIQISVVRFDGPDRIAFQVRDGWNEADTDQERLWSCTRDGRDPKRLPALTGSETRIASKPVNGSPWLVLATGPEGKESIEPIVGPIGNLAAVAFHR